eukprot:6457643-Amphidinium_carterae.4
MGFLVRRYSLANQDGGATQIAYLIGWRQDQSNGALFYDTVTQARAVVHGDDFLLLGDEDDVKAMDETKVSRHMDNLMRALGARWDQSEGIGLPISRHARGAEKKQRDRHRASRVHYIGANASQFQEGRQVPTLPPVPSERLPETELARQAHSHGGRRLCGRPSVKEEHYRSSNLPRLTLCQNPEQLAIRSQLVTAACLSSGQVEHYEIVKAMAMGFLMKSFLADFGIDVGMLVRGAVQEGVEFFSDSCQKHAHATVEAVNTAHNVADALTKPVEQQTSETQVIAVGGVQRYAHLSSSAQVAQRPKREREYWGALAFRGKGSVGHSHIATTTVVAEV